MALATSAPPLSAAVEQRRRACVLDASLALSPYGLTLAQRLSAEVELWVVRELWRMLDNTNPYLESYAESSVTSSISHGADGQRTESFYEAIQQWDVARAERDLAGLNVFWVGDGISDSLLPPGNDAQIVSRFDVLGSALDARIDAPARFHDASIERCARDAVALTVALSARRSFILTVCELEEPYVCGCLGEWGIPCTRVRNSRGLQIEQGFFHPLLARAGIAELLWAGLRLAVVHVVARRAAVIPSFGMTSGEMFDVNDADVASWWAGAESFWYPLNDARDLE